MPLNRNKPLIMHIDLNSCFATCTQQAFVHLRGKPLVMVAYDTPNGCVLSPSIEAKRHGIKTGMTLREARLLCPRVISRMTDTVMVRDVHIKFKRIFKDYSPNVTPKSIDEAILDFHDMERVLKNRSLTEIGNEIKRRMRREIGEWISCSVGISTNRFLAKQAAGLKKPDGLEVITHENLRQVLSKLTLIDLNGINHKFQARLNIHGIYTPLQFLDAPLPVLKNQVFQSIVGYYWYKRLRGWEVDDYDTQRKSIGQDYALAKKTADPQELSKILMKLCEKMGRRLRRHNLTAKGIHVALVYEDWTYWHKGRQVDGKMYATMELYRKAQWMMNQAPQGLVVSKMSVSCYDLEPCGESQMSLFDAGPEKIRRVSDALDKINDKYGEFIITPAIMMGMDDTVIDRIAFGAVKELEDLYAGSIVD